MNSYHAFYHRNLCVYVWWVLMCIDVYWYWYWYGLMPNFGSSRTAPDLGGDRRRPLIGSPDGETTQSRHAVPAWNRRVVMGLPPMVQEWKKMGKYGWEIDGSFIEWVGKQKKHIPAKTSSIFEAILGISQLPPRSSWASCASRTSQCTDRAHHDSGRKGLRLYLALAALLFWQVSL